MKNSEKQTTHQDKIYALNNISRLYFLDVTYIIKSIAIVGIVRFLIPVFSFIFICFYALSRTNSIYCIQCSTHALTVLSYSSFKRTYRQLQVSFKSWQISVHVLKVLQKMRRMKHLAYFIDQYIPFQKRKKTQNRFCRPRSYANGLSAKKMYRIFKPRSWCCGILNEFIYKIYAVLSGLLKYRGYRRLLLRNHQEKKATLTINEEDINAHSRQVRNLRFGSIINGFTLFKSLFSVEKVLRKTNARWSRRFVVE